MKDGWARKRLIELLQKTGTVDPTKEPQKQFTYIDVSSVSNETFTIAETSELLGKDAPSRARRSVFSGDIIFATIRPTLKRIAIVPNELDGAVCSTGYFVLRGGAKLDNRFLFYWLFSSEFQAEMEARQKGASYPAVNDSDIRDQYMPVPPLDEQRRIVGVLDKAFAVIATATANAQKNLTNARALFERCLADSYQIEGAAVALGSIAKFVRGPFGGSLKKSIFQPSGFAVYEQQHAIYDQFDDVRYFISKSKFDEMVRFQVLAGDVLMSCSGTIGRVALVPAGISPGVINQALLKLSPSKKVNGPYLLWYMRSKKFREQIAARSGGAALQNVASVAVLKEIVVPLPSEADQLRVVSRISDLKQKSDALANMISAKLAALTELKQSFLQKAFAGELT